MAALGASTLPALAAPGEDPASAPTAVSVWGKKADPESVPPVKVGANRPPANVGESVPSAAEAAWRAAQKERANTGESTSSSAARSTAAVRSWVPRGQGAVPWHQISDVRVTDSLVARINLSNGNLMLAATDFDVAGVGQKLRLARTYSSLDAPWGKVSQRWWQEYERYLSLYATEVVLFGAIGDAASFTKNADGSFSTPKGYSKDLRKNADGTYTLTDRRSGAKDTYDQHGTLTKVTDALERSRSSKYDANNNVQETTDAMGTGGVGGNVTTYGWDSRNNPTGSTLPTGATASVTGYQTIAGADLPGRSATADGEKTDYAYDTVGNTKSVAVQGTGGGNQSFDYNPATPTCGGFEGQVCKVTTRMTASKSVATNFTYDATGNLKTVKAPAPLGTTTYAYDGLGRVSSARDARGVTILYEYDHRDRVKKVDSSNYQAVSYAYDGDGNLTLRSDGTGVIKYAFDPLSRETVRTLQNGSQTVLAYTPAGNVDTYQDPAGLTDYTWNKVNKLAELKDPTGKVTKYAYNKNDVRTTTTYPGNTVQTVTPDKSGRPEKIKATSAKGTLVDLAYTYGYGTDGATDGTKIRTTTDAVAGTKTSYEYDSAGRFSYAAENKGATLNSSWQYCYDLAGNLTSQGVDKGCPRGTTYTTNDAQQITAKNGSTTNWSYDQIGNETAAAPTPESTRTGVTWSDYSQMTSITSGGKTYAGQYGSTDQSERIKLGDTFFHNGPLGLSATSTAGVDTGFNREPGGTLNSMTRGGKNHYYLTDALGSVVALADETGTKVNTYAYSPRGVQRAGTSEQVPQPYRFAGGYQDPTGLYHFAARYYDPNIGRFTTPDPSGLEKNPYLYAAGDPVNTIDPTGLWSVMDTINTTIAVVGLAAAVPTGGASLTVLTAVGLVGAQTGLAVAVGCGFSENC
ncbi:DUF6531 domain-containing protein [Streptomyces griseobrunneus]